MKASPLDERIAMSQPDITTQQPQGEKKNMSLLIRGSLWIAIGALIAAALVCVIWVLIGDQDGLIGRAFLTILLLAAFAGIAILEAGLAPNRPDWLQLASMVSWIVALLVGAVKIWLPEDGYYFGAERFFQLLLVIGILQLALLHVRLFTPAAQRYVTTFTRVIYIVTITFLAALVGMLVFFLAFPNTFHYGELYWRIVVALTILVAVGTTLIPLLNALFAPKKKEPRAPAAAAAPSWPTYADGISPLPALHDGSPDWNAYYTGYPTVTPPPQALAQAPASSFPIAPQPIAPQPAAPQSFAPPAVPVEPPVASTGPQSPAPQQGEPPAFPPPPPAPQQPTP
jgi:MFS family permease